VIHAFRHPAALAVLVVSAAIASLLSWGYLAENGGRVWADLLFVLAQNAMMLSSVVYSVATLAAMVTLHPRTPLLASLCLLTAALFVAMSTPPWLSLMGSREFRASPHLPLQEALLAENALRQSQYTPPAARMVLVPHTMSLVPIAPERILDIRQQRRTPGSPPVIDPAPDPPAVLKLETKVKLSLGMTSVEETLDRYPPDWLIAEISSRAWPPAPPAPQRSRRQRTTR